MAQGLSSSERARTMEQGETPLPRFEQVVKLHHRTLDPAVLFWEANDEKLPDSKTCYERAGLDNKVAHTAVEDAQAVVRLVRMGINNLKRTVQ